MRRLKWRATIRCSRERASLLEVRDLCVDFGAFAALEDVSFDLSAGETVGLVGESGSGKSTLARAILRLVPAARGTVMWRGLDLLSCDAATLRRQRRDLQIVFQDPLASLNPRMTVGETLAEPLKIFEPRALAASRGERESTTCWSASALPAAWPIAIRTSSAAGNASASASRAR